VKFSPNAVELVIARFIKKTKIDFHLRKSLQQQVPILMYHNISGSYSGEASCLNLANMTISAGRFREHLEFIRKFYTTITFADYVRSRLEGRSLPANSCIISFDDGFENVMTIAVPILREFGFTATFFVIGKVLRDGELPWLHALYTILDNAPIQVSFQALRQVAPRLFTERYPTKDITKVAILKRIRHYVKKIDAAQRKELVRRIIGLIGDYKEGAIRFLSGVQVRELAASGFEVGCHSFDHEYMARLDLKQAEQDIRMSTQIISDAAGKEVRCFCYPFGGVNSWNSHTNSLLKAFQYNCACTTLEGLNGRTRDMFELRRVRVDGELPTEVLMLRMLGLRAWIWELYSAFKKIGREYGYTFRI